MAKLRPDRRALFKSLIALSAIGGLAACAPAEDAASKTDLGNADAGYFTASEMALIAALAQTIIPRTDTAGAIEAGVPQTLQDLATHWGNSAYQRYWRDGLADLSEALRSKTGAGFETLSDSAREAILLDYDTQMFADAAKNGFYRVFKATAVEAYYMSEPGATEELAYEPVPGEWIGCVPLSEYPKTWAT